MSSISKLFCDWEHKKPSKAVQIFANKLGLIEVYFVNKTLFCLQREKIYVSIYFFCLRLLTLDLVYTNSSTFLILGALRKDFLRVIVPLISSTGTLLVLLWSTRHGSRSGHAIASSFPLSYSICISQHGTRSAIVLSLQVLLIFHAR